MKYQSLTLAFIIVSLPYTGIAGEHENVDTKSYWKIMGNINDLEEFASTGVCHGCDLRLFDLRDILKKLAAEGKTIDVSESDMRGANLSDANLRNAIFRGVKADHARFDHAQCEKANFRGAHLEEASFHSADLTDAELMYLSGKHIQMAEANLDRTKFSGAYVPLSCFYHVHNVDSSSLSRADNLDGITFDEENDLEMQKIRADFYTAKAAQIERIEFLKSAQVDFLESTREIDVKKR